MGRPHLARRARGRRLPIEAAGWGSYLHRRHDVHGNLNGRGPYVNADPCQVIRDTWAYAQSQPDGNLGVAVDPDRQPGQGRHHRRARTAPTGGRRRPRRVVDDMTQPSRAARSGPRPPTGPPADPQADPPRLAPPGHPPHRHLLRHRHQRGRHRAVTYDADAYAQVVIALGAGEGRGRRRAIDAIRNGRLRLEHVLEVPAEKGSDRLAARARTERTSRQVLGEVTEIEVIDHRPPGRLMADRRRRPRHPPRPVDRFRGLVPRHRLDSASRRRLTTPSASPHPRPRRPLHLRELTHVANDLAGWRRASPTSNAASPSRPARPARVLLHRERRARRLTTRAGSLRAVIGQQPTAPPPSTSSTPRRRPRRASPPSRLFSAASPSPGRASSPTRSRRWISPGSRSTPPPWTQFAPQRPPARHVRIPARQHPDHPHRPAAVRPPPGPQHLRHGVRLPRPPERAGRPSAVVARRSSTASSTRLPRRRSAVSQRQAPDRRGRPQPARHRHRQPHARRFEGAFTDQLVAAPPSGRSPRATALPRGYASTAPARPGLPSLLRHRDWPSPRGTGSSSPSTTALRRLGRGLLRLYLRWQDATGAVLGYGTAIATPPGRRLGHRHHQVQAPAGTVTASCGCGTPGSAGTADFDNATSAPSSARAWCWPSPSAPGTGRGVDHRRQGRCEHHHGPGGPGLSLTGDEIAQHLTARHIARGLARRFSHLRIGTTGTSSPTLVRDAASSPAARPSPYDVVDDDGNNSAKCAAHRRARAPTGALQHCHLARAPGERYWLAADYSSRLRRRQGDAMYARLLRRRRHRP